MNKERAIEILEKIKSKSEEYIKNSQTRINTTDLTPLKNAFVRKQEYAKEKVQAIDIAIESLNGWVDVRDRLPSESGWYWVTQKFDFKGEFEHQNETDYEVDREYFDSTKNEFDYTHKYIIAWQTYYEPQPYERKE